MYPPIIARFAGHLEGTGDVSSTPSGVYWKMAFLKQNIGHLWEEAVPKEDA